MSHSRASHEFVASPEQLEEWAKLQEKHTKDIHVVADDSQAKIDFLATMVPISVQEEYGTYIDYYSSELIRNKLVLYTYPKHGLNQPTPKPSR